MNALRVPLTRAPRPPFVRPRDDHREAAPAHLRPPHPPPPSASGRAISTCPTYEEGLPDVNPPFDLFETAAASTIPTRCAHNLTDRRAVSALARRSNLENEYLKRRGAARPREAISTAASDKSNGAEMFYANASHQEGAGRLSRARGRRCGIEFNFPVSHNWVDRLAGRTTRCSATRDGSASIWVGNADRVYGMQWRVALTPAPGPVAPRAGRRALQPQRHAAPLLLVEQRGACASGTTAASTIPMRVHGLPRLHARSTPGP